MRKMKNKYGAVLEKRNETSEDKLFEKVKVEMLMRLRGISRDEALGIVGENNKTRKPQPYIEEDEQEDDLLMPPEGFFHV